MAIPKNILREHVEKAIQEINPLHIPSHRMEKNYSIVENGKSLPIKYVISIANRIANGVELESNEFNAIEAKNYLKKLNYNVLEKRNEEDKKSVKIWIEKTIVAGREDRINGERQLGKVLWSPQKGKPNKTTGTQADVYKNMRFVESGDIILHLIDNQKFAGISISNGTVQEAEGLQGTEWEGPAYLINLKNYTALTPSIDRSDILNEKYKMSLKEISNSSEVFYNDNLDLRQGAYLTPCPLKLLEILNIVYKQKSGNDLPLINSIDFPMNTTTTFHLSKYLKYYLSIKTKPFIILAGLSGTGKSRLVRTLAYQFNNIETDIAERKNPPTNFQLIKVKPNWHDSSELLGYESRISGKDRFVSTDFIRFIVKAWQHPATPFFLCLDEMNLAPVEQYFAEYLSAIETRRVNDGRIKTDALISGKLITKYAEKANGVDETYDLWNELELTDNKIQNEVKANGISLPSNLIVMGTVNMDETTYSFSRKVLDRAMTIEMNEINLSEGLGAEAVDWNYPEEPLKKELVLSEKTQGTEVYAELSTTGEKIIAYLDLINTKLEGSPFKIAYRVRDEFLLYAFNYSLLETKPDNWIKSILDEMTLMKILPRIEGDEDKTRLLDDLIILFQENNLPKSLNKATEMINRRKLSHYTSFWS